MQYWNNIINTALLGTAKKTADTTGFQGPLLEAAGTILADTSLDREDQFLHMAAVVYNYRQSGVQPSSSDASLPVCEPENKKYCHTTAVQSLLHTIDTENIPLLSLWLESCARAKVIVPPPYLPLILETAYRHKPLRNLAAACCGRRGEWLSQFNKDWNFSVVADTPEEQWQNGTTAQRLAALTALRERSPETALQWLQETWNKESAVVKSELVTALAVNVSQDDVPWLESLLAEKSKQVRENALLLLKKVPGTALHDLYRQVLLDAIQEDEAGNITCQLSADLDESLFRSGIEKMSSNTGISDNDFILAQLITFVHPGVWEKHFHRPFDQVVQLFQQQPALQPFTTSLVKAIVWFEDTKRALSFMQHSELFDSSLLPLLPPEKQDEYMLRHIDEHSNELILYATQMKEEWSEALALKILAFCARYPYTYSQSAVGNFIAQIPVSVKSSLENITTENENYKTYWKSISAHLSGLLQVKAFIIQSFSENIKSL